MKHQQEDHHRFHNHHQSSWQLALQHLSIALQVRTLGAVRQLQQYAFDEHAKQYSTIVKQNELPDDDFENTKNLKQNEAVPSPLSVLSRTNTSKPFHIRALFHLWNHALASGDATAVADKYSTQATLLSSSFILEEETILLHGYKDILRHYQELLLVQHSSVECRIVEGAVIVHSAHLAQDVGICEYLIQNTTKGEGVEIVVVKCTYSFLYSRCGDDITAGRKYKWKIVQHHVSQINSFMKPNVDQEYRNQGLGNLTASEEEAAAGAVSCDSQSESRTKPPHRRSSQIQQLVSILLRRQSVTESIRQQYRLQ